MIYLLEHYVVVRRRAGVNLRFSFVSTVLVASFVAGGCVYAQTASESQSVTLQDKVKIPGASLKPGTYTFSVEDRLQDRAIVRITSQDQSKHFLVLTVPSAKLAQQGSDGLVRFTTPNGKDGVLRGWACPGCTPGLEFVYPKAEAAKLTDETAEPILAVDPTYDKLPANLSPDDMKVVTLWLLSPERITASNKGKGVKAEKYASVAQPAAATQVASVSTSELAQSPVPAAKSETAQDVKPAVPSAANTPSNTSEVAQQPVPAVAPAVTARATAPVVAESAPAAQATQLASANTMPASRMPKTASSNYLYLFGGMLLVMASLGLRLSRRRFAFSR